MEKFKTVESRPAPLDSSNVDTDQIIPKQFLKRIERTGFGEFLFFDWRFNDDGTVNSKFILNETRFKDSEILLSQENFGCGSSREHAPWALRDYGFKVIISTSFADILYNNCFKNCILPVIVDEEMLDYFFNSTLNFEDYKLRVDLENMVLSDNKKFSHNLDVDSYRRKCLLEGLDDIALTLVHEKKITIYENELSE
jgi:3-isopropylmalate/(R)-2-methylmalate dehydratase small subunit